MNEATHSVAVEIDKIMATAAEFDKIMATNVPRCGTCGSAIHDLHADTDEGYSHCCNDRVEYPGEWQLKPETVAEWAADRVARRAHR
jgi:hypothetical protein